MIVAPSNSVTVALASAVPANAGVVTLVMLSVLDAPVSDDASRSGAPGATGAAVSMVTASAAEAVLTLPARSVAFALTACTPFANVLLVIDQAPPASA